MQEKYVVTETLYKKPVREGESCGPFRSWWVTRDEPHLFVQKFLCPYIKEFSYKVFDTQDEMLEYAKKRKIL